MIKTPSLFHIYIAFLLNNLPLLSLSGVTLPPFCITTNIMFVSDNFIGCCMCWPVASIFYYNIYADWTGREMYMSCCIYTGNFGPRHSRSLCVGRGRCTTFCRLTVCRLSISTSRHLAECTFCRNYVEISPTFLLIWYKTLMFFLKCEHREIIMYFGKYFWEIMGSCWWNLFILQFAKRNV